MKKSFLFLLLLSNISKAQWKHSFIVEKTLGYNYKHKKTKKQPASTNSSYP